MANKWILNEFRNRIGLIGSKKKLNIIKNLLKHSEYREYINNDYFTDYIGIDDKNTISIVMPNIVKLTCSQIPPFTLAKYTKNINPTALAMTTIPWVNILAISSLSQ